jgi:hypothetical protein
MAAQQYGLQRRGGSALGGGKVASNKKGTLSVQ